MCIYPGLHADELTVLSVGHDIWIVNINTKEHVTLRQVIAKYLGQIDVDEEYIYWTDLDDKSINSINWDGTNRTVMQKLSDRKCLFFYQCACLSLAVLEL